MLEEQKAIVERLVTDKAELLQKNHDTQSHYDNQIEDLKNQLNTKETEKLNVLEHSRILTENIETLQQQLETVKETPKVEDIVQASVVNSSLVDNAEIETMKNEKETIE